jgi:hypothetical protein
MTPAAAPQTEQQRVAELVLLVHRLLEEVTQLGISLASQLPAETVPELGEWLRKVTDDAGAAVAEITGAGPAPGFAAPPPSGLPVIPR